MLSFFPWTRTVLPPRYLGLVNGADTVATGTRNSTSGTALFNLRGGRLLDFTEQSALDFINQNLSQYQRNADSEHDRWRQIAVAQLTKDFQEWQNRQRRGVPLAALSQGVGLARLTQPNLEETLQLAHIGNRFLCTVLVSFVSSLRVKNLDGRKALKELHGYVGTELGFLYENVWQLAGKIAPFNNSISMSWRVLHQVTFEGAPFLHALLEADRPETVLWEITERLLSGVGKVHLKSASSDGPTFSGEAKDRATKAIQQPSEDDWFYYHLLDEAEMITADGTLLEDEDSREGLLSLMHKKKVPLPANVRWDVPGWRGAIESNWHQNTKQFFRGKLKRCRTWLQQNSGKEIPKGKRFQRA